MDSSEQLLVDVVSVICDIFPDVNIISAKSKVSSIISKYKIQIEESQDVQTDLHEKIDMYLSSKKLEGLSPKTLKNYELDLTKFANNIKKITNDITSADIRVYLGKFNHLKMSSLGEKLFILKSFFNWLHSEYIIERNPTANLKQPKAEKRIPKGLTIEELETVRESCETLRERALLEVFYSTGCRLTEIVNMNTSDINIQNMSVNIIGKGNKERIVYLSFKALYHLKKYLKNRGDDCEALFITERKPYRRMKQRAIQREIDKIEKKSNISKKLTPHVLRHSFACLSMDAGIELTDLQHLMGHAEPSVTLVYANVSEKRKQEAFKKFHIQ